LKKNLFAIPAAIGFLLHAPIYFPAKAMNRRHFDNNHFESTLAGMRVLAYPLYLALFFLIAAIV
jgi:hypothetical protein